MDARDRRAKEEERAWAAFLTNLVVLPGLGTFLYGRRLLGLAQIALAGMGFLLICVWLLGFLGETIATTAWPEGGGPDAGKGLLGLGLSMLSLAWSGGWGYALWRDAQRRG